MPRPAHEPRAARPRRAAVGVAALLLILVPPGVTRAAEQDKPVPWPMIQAMATTFVDRESPDTVWPFDADLKAREGREVLVHYFTPFAPSTDNKPPAVDYWATQALSPMGLNGKYFSQGGYVRERPLPIPPWPSPYWHEIDAAIDVLRARKMGADGFIVAIFGLPPTPLWQAARRLCAAAAAVAPGFRIIPQLDANALPLDVTAEQMVQAVADMAGCGALPRTGDGRLRVAVYDPAKRTPAFWQAVLTAAQGQGMPLALMPVYLDPVRSAESFAAVTDGMAYWGAADPRGVTGPGSGEGALQAVIARHADWMAPVRPQDFRPKSAIVFEAGNTETFRALWAFAIENRAPRVHIVTWNDYTESTEVEPSSRSQFLWYDLSRYYIAAYKHGSAPPIRRDALYYSHRGQIFDATLTHAPGTVPIHVLGATPVQNKVEMVAMLTAGATLAITIGDQECRQPAGPGLAVLSCPARPGRPVFRIIRNGHAVVETTSAWTIDAASDREDALYDGGSSTRAPVAKAAE